MHQAVRLFFGIARCFYNINQAQHINICLLTLDRVCLVITTLVVTSSVVIGCPITSKPLKPLPLRGTAVRSHPSATVSYLHWPCPHVQLQAPSKLPPPNFLFYPFTHKSFYHTCLFPKRLTIAYTIQISSQ